MDKTCYSQAFLPWAPTSSFHIGVQLSVYIAGFCIWERHISYTFNKSCLTFRSYLSLLDILSKKLSIISKVSVALTATGFIVLHLFCILIYQLLKTFSGNIGLLQNLSSFLLSTYISYYVLVMLFLCFEVMFTQLFLS